MYVMTGCSRLVPARLLEGAMDKIHFELLHFIIKIHSTSQIDIIRDSLRSGDHLCREFGIADLRTETFDGYLVRRCNNDGPLDYILEFPDVTRVIVVLEQGQNFGPDRFRNRAAIQIGRAHV